MNVLHSLNTKNIRPSHKQRKRVAQISNVENQQDWVKKRVKITNKASKKKLDKGSAGFRKTNAAEEIATKGRPLNENKNMTNIEPSSMQSKLSPVISSRRLKSQNEANPAPNDQSKLTQYMCILRQQIEFFEVYVLFNDRTKCPRRFY